MKKSMWIALMGAIAMMAGACGGTVAANDVEVGTCTNLGAADEAVGEIDEIDCDESHTAEVFALFDVDGDAFPGLEAINADAFDGCTGSRFQGYIDAPFETSEVFVTFLTPTQETWDEADDRTIICIAIEEELASRTGSVRGLGR